MAKGNQGAGRGREKKLRKRLEKAEAAHLRAEQQLERRQALLARAEVRLQRRAEQLAAAREELTSLVQPSGGTAGGADESAVNGDYAGVPASDGAEAGAAESIEERAAAAGIIVPGADARDDAHDDGRDDAQDDGRNDAQDEQA